jgi:hypothetical protein
MKKPARTSLVVWPLLQTTLVVLLASSRASGAEPEDAKVVEARAQYVRGNELAKTAQWAQALAAFERSRELRPHPLTTYNLAICERALGNLLRARGLFAAAMKDGAKDAAQFPSSRVDDARTYITEIDASLVHLEVRAEPEDAMLAVDGRPLERVLDEEGQTRLMAGTARPGAPERVPGKTFALVIDPGTHVFRVVAKGYGDISLNKTYSPGQKEKLDIELARLPATVRIGTDVPESIVTVNGADVGYAPVQVSRPAGTYQIVVRRTGFETFSAKLALTPGQEVDVPAKLPPERIPITKKWWFWGTVIGVVAGGSALTYVLTREEPAPPPYSGGTTGWVVTPR